MGDLFCFVFKKPYYLLLDELELLPEEEPSLLRELLLLDSLVLLLLEEEPSFERTLSLLLLVFELSLLLREGVLSVLTAALSLLELEEERVPTSELLLLEVGCDELLSMVEELRLERVSGEELLPLFQSRELLELRGCDTLSDVPLSVVREEEPLLYSLVGELWRVELLLS